MELLIDPVLTDVENERHNLPGKRVVIRCDQHALRKRTLLTIPEWS